MTGYKVDDNYVYTIEGNTSGASGVIPNGGGVCRKTYYRTYSAICGYGRPDYSLVKESATEARSSVSVTLGMVRKGNKGADIKSIQTLLIHKHGISCGAYGADGDFGSATDKAVRQFQQQRKLEVDGIVGSETWKALIN